MSVKWLFGYLLGVHVSMLVCLGAFYLIIEDLAERQDDQEWNQAKMKARLRLLEHAESEA